VRLAALGDAEPPPAAAPPTAWSKTVLEGGLFAAGSDRLTPDAASPLSAVARQIRETKAGAVRIVGHTDGNGEADKNRRLSLRRAQAVRDYLVATYGFDAARFAVEGQGATQPVASNETASGRRANRRVEVFVAR
jgi:outer membrane protein OmpA-like peptidoglycan-associated protein